MEINFYKWAKGLFICGFCVLVFLTILFLSKTTKINFSAPLSTEVWDHFGSVIGGLVGTLFSLASILLLIYTIKEQKLDNQRQKVETRFFEMLGVYRANLNEIQVNEKIGRYAIQGMVRELSICREMVTTIYNRIKIDYDEEKLLNFGYIAFFFGCVDVPNIKNSNTFRQQVKGFDQKFVEQFIAHCTQERENLDFKINVGHELFLGHQIRLGTYFRHLFHIVKYINDQPRHVLSYEERYEYMRILKAQFSPHEQILLFNHSLSHLGHAWEKRYPSDPNRQFITKYNLIRNIHLVNERLLKYYPCVEYENWPFPECRKLLIKKYY